MRLLLHAFPSSFRRRYGDELIDMVQASGSPLRDGTNVVFAGLRMRIASNTFGMALVSVAALGSAALGGCVLLGSAAAGGAGALLANRLRVSFAG